MNENIENEVTEETVDPKQAELEEKLKKYKEAIDKASSEANKFKKQWREAEEKLKQQMPEDERAKAEREERFKAIEEENARLKRDMTISQKTNFYLSLGFDAELAQETAEAFVDGDYETVEANQLKAHQDFEKAIRADVVRNTPHPQNTGGTGGITKAEIMAIRDPIERQKKIAENMELFI